MTEAVCAGQSLSQGSSWAQLSAQHRGRESALVAAWVEIGFYLETTTNTSLQTTASAFDTLEPRKSA